MKRDFENLGKVTIGILEELFESNKREGISVYPTYKLDKQENILETGYFTIELYNNTDIKSSEEYSGTSEIEIKSLSIDRIVSEVYNAILFGKGNIKVSLCYGYFTYGHLSIFIKQKIFAGTDILISIENAIVRLLRAHYNTVDFKVLDNQAKDGSLFKKQVDTTEEFKRIIEKIGIGNLVKEFGDDLAESIVKKAGLDPNILIDYNKAYDEVDSEKRDYRDDSLNKIPMSTVERVMSPVPNVKPAMKSLELPNLGVSLPNWEEESSFFSSVTSSSVENKQESDREETLQEVSGKITEAKYRYVSKQIQGDGNIYTVGVHSQTLAKKYILSMYNLMKNPSKHSINSDWLAKQVKQMANLEMRVKLGIATGEDTREWDIRKKLMPLDIVKSYLNTIIEFMINNIGDEGYVLKTPYRDWDSSFDLFTLVDSGVERDDNSTNYSMIRYYSLFTLSECLERYDSYLDIDKNIDIRSLLNFMRKGNLPKELKDKAYYSDSILMLYYNKGLYATLSFLLSRKDLLREDLTREDEVYPLQLVSKRILEDLLSFNVSVQYNIDVAKDILYEYLKFEYLQDLDSINLKETRFWAQTPEELEKRELFREKRREKSARCLYENQPDKWEQKLKNYRKGLNSYARIKEEYLNKFN